MRLGRKTITIIAAVFVIVYYILNPNHVPDKLTYTLRLNYGLKDTIMSRVRKEVWRFNEGQKLFFFNFKKKFSN